MKHEIVDLFVDIDRRLTDLKTHVRIQKTDADRAVSKKLAAALKVQVANLANEIAKS